MNTTGFHSTFGRKLRHGLRVLRKSPWLTAGRAAFAGSRHRSDDVDFIPPRRNLVAFDSRCYDPNQGRAAYKVGEVLRMRELSAFSAVMATAPEGRIRKGDQAPENFPAIQLSANALSSFSASSRFSAASLVSLTSVQSLARGEEQSDERQQARILQPLAALYPNADWLFADDRSRMPSAAVGSPMCACHRKSGSWGVKKPIYEALACERPT